MGALAVLTPDAALCLIRLCLWNGVWNSTFLVEKQLILAKMFFEFFFKYVEIMKEHENV